MRVTLSYCHFAHFSDQVRAMTIDIWSQDGIVSWVIVTLMTKTFHLKQNLKKHDLIYWT